MSRREASGDMLHEARREAERQGLRMAELERNHARLAHLYEISKLLMRLADPRRTMIQVIALMAETIPVRSAILLLDALGLPEQVLWCGAEHRGERIEPAHVHARAAYDYLMHTGDERLEAKTRARAGASRLTRDSGTELAPGGRYIVLPLLVPQGHMLGTLQIEGAEPLDEDALMFVNAVVNLISVGLHRQSLTIITQREQQLLASVGTILGAYVDRKATLSAVARCVVPLFADLCIIDEVASDGTVRRLEVVFADQQKQHDLVHEVQRFVPRPGWKTPQAVVLESGRPLLFSNVIEPFEQGIAHDAEHAQVILATGMRSMMALPLQARGRMLGAITLVMAESGRRYGASDLVLAGEFARRVATAIDNVWLYEKAQQATRSRQDLLAVVSHDLKNPLSSILMTASVLLNLTVELDRRKAGRKHLELIKRAAERMNRLIEDLLDTASIEGGQLSVSIGSLDLVPQITEALEAVQAHATKKSLRLESELPPTLPRVRADPARLQQVLVNLLHNAIKFTPNGGSVTIRATAENDRETVSITDTGPGIPASELPRLFDRFWQARRTARLGTGLGLFIVKGIVSAHGGEVWVESALGVGSTFFFTLPVVTETTI